MNVVELCKKKRAINVRMYCELIIDVVVWLLVWLLLKLAELKSRGWCIYRGNAAEISVEFNIRLNLNA